MKPVFILLFLLLCLPHDGYSQVAGMRVYTQLDGFQAASGYLIQQDERGYIWMGTDNGGVRFDGRTFKELQPLHRSENSEILECTPMRHGQVAIVPLAGDLMILDHDTINAAFLPPWLRQRSSKQTNVFRRDISTGFGWLWDGAYQHKMYRFDTAGIQTFTKTDTGFLVQHLLGGRLLGWHLIDEYLGFYEPERERVHPLYHTDHSRINYMQEHPVLLLNSRDHVLTYDQERQLLHIYRWPSGDTVLREINRLSLALQPPVLKTVFSGYANGRQYFVSKHPNNRFMYCRDAADPKAASNMLQLDMPGNINSPFVDNHNNLWFSSSDNALYFLSEKHINNAILAAQVPLRNRNPKCIAGAGGRLYISYPNSNILTIISGRIARHYPLKAAFSDGCRKIEAIRNGCVVFYDGDIGLLHTRSGKITYFNLEQAAVKDVCTYGTEGFLAAVCYDLLYFSRTKDGSYQKRSVFDRRRSTAVKVLAHDQVLIGTPKGLFRKNGVDGAAQLIDHPLLAQKYITDILPLDGSTALISTNGSGLLRYSLDGTIRLIQPARGVASIPVHIRQLYRQDSNTVWAATDEGACMLQLDAGGDLASARLYSFYDGLPSNNVTGIYTLQDTAYVATPAGLGVLPLKDTSILKMTAPTLYIDLLQAGDRAFNTPENPLRIAYNQNDLLLWLNGISYESLGNINYYYRLAPMQEDWIQTADPEIRFTQLAPGDYVFEAFATNAKGVKSKLVRLPLFIKPAFWQTFYFKVALLLLALLLLAAAARWQLKRSEKKRHITTQQNKHLAELELEAIKAQINPHFIYNCLNSIQYLNYKADYEQAQQYLGMFSRLIRMTMQYSQKVFISVHEEIAYLSAYLQMEQLRFKEQLTYTIDIDEAVAQHSVMPAMLLQPHVENALKHGIAGQEQGGAIHIRFSQSGDNLEISIRDNGPGFANRDTADSLGLRLSGARARTYQELYHIPITIRCYNVQESDTQQTGAVVQIIINQKGNGKTIYTGSHHR